MARPIWTGAVAFGLVTVPVNLHPATSRQERLAFRLLHARDQAPIDYRRICSVENVEVAWADVVKGYEYKKGRFVVMTEADFERARPPAAQTIDIRDFVPGEQIDFSFFDAPYWLEPTPPGRTAYALLRRALADSGRVGIGTLVMREREHLAALRPAANALMLTTMRFAHELRPPAGLDIPAEDRLEPRQLALARQLVDTLAGDFEPAQYRDTYTDVLRAAIERKLAGKEIRPAGARPAAGKVVDLVKALEASIRRGRRPLAKAAARERGAGPRAAAAVSRRPASSRAR